MGFLLKTVAAFCLGAVLLAGAQRAWLSSIVTQVKWQSTAGLNLPQAKPVYSFDKSNFDNLIAAMHPKVIDTSAAQRAWANSLAHQQSLNVRTWQNMANPRLTPGHW
jgi:hypothetical protein